MKAKILGIERQKGGEKMNGRGRGRHEKGKNWGRKEEKSEGKKERRRIKSQGGRIGNEVTQTTITKRTAWRERERTGRKTTISLSRALFYARVVCL